MSVHPGWTGTMCRGDDCWYVAKDRGFCPLHAPMLDITCRWCDRYCPRCHYFIPGGAEHIEQPQAPESRHFVCTYKPARKGLGGPLVEVLAEYLTHSIEHAVKAVSA